MWIDLGKIRDGKRIYTIQQSQSSFYNFAFYGGFYDWGSLQKSKQVVLTEKVLIPLNTDCIIKQDLQNWYAMWIDLGKIRDDKNLYNPAKPKLYRCSFYNFAFMVDFIIEVVFINPDTTSRTILSTKLNGFPFYFRFQLKILNTIASNLIHAVSAFL